MSEWQGRLERSWPRRRWAGRGTGSWDESKAGPFYFWPKTVSACIYQ